MNHNSRNTLSDDGYVTSVEHVAPADVLTPADRYEELFVAVQTRRVFADSKTFVDVVPLHDPAEIMRRYRADQALPGFDLHQFVSTHFTHEAVPESHYVSKAGQSMAEHIDGLWDVLTRYPARHPPQSSLLPIPCNYVVPGGRFSEMYYWDSYFTMLGLAQSGRSDLLHTMAENFAYLIDTHGHIPNGNRSYYLSRSQPPVFALMVLLFEKHGINRAVRYLPQLRKEYSFWMDGADSLANGEARRHVVRLSDGSLLNRYWDDRDTPREEGYMEDVMVAAATTRPASEVYRELRAGAESGWDFSTRWLDNPQDLSTIRTTAILPVDLNSFMFTLETQIERLSLASGDVEAAATFHEYGLRRRAAINQYLWSDREGAFFDYDWQRDEPRAELSAATAVPLYVSLATRAQAYRTARAIESRLLTSGGMLTTEQTSAQQWDRSNGWAPLQWMAVRGLRRYGEHVVSQQIAHNWIETVGLLYEREWKLVEKYSLLSPYESRVGGGSGGEYPLQDGFGWTNGVTRLLLDQHPDHRIHRCHGQARSSKS
jgi:alpha,alpha-trehalase